MATARLRKTFHYPSEEDATDSPDELDEQDQEELITELATHDARTNDFYRLAFAALPLLATLPYLPAVVVPASARAALVALLSLTSLAASAYVMYALPLRDPDPKGKRPLYMGDPRGPVERYMVPLNSTLSVFLALVAGLAWRRELVDEFWRGVLPGAIFLVILFARSQMAPIDTTALARLKYNYKGA